MSSSNAYIIILTGGGTGGSVTPLLALVNNMTQDDYEVRWIGTYSGLEKALVTETGLTYYGISSGKWRRYFSVQNLFDPFKVLVGFIQALLLLHKIKPALIVSAGGFVSVPVVWAAWLLRYPILIHQQDVRPGLANRLMAPCATTISVTFAKSLADYGHTAVWTGNPVRQEFEAVKKNFPHIEEGKKNILVIGGGTGSEAINHLVQAGLSDLSAIDSITHITGQEIDKTKVWPKNYHPYQFLDARAVAEAMIKATLVISRAGLGTITELAYLNKAAIIIPMPNSHQEDNAQYLAEQGAALILQQADLTPPLLAAKINALLDDSAQCKKFELAMSGLIKPEARQQIYNIIQEIIKRPV